MPLSQALHTRLIDLHRRTMGVAIKRGQESFREGFSREVFCAMGLAGEAGEVANLYKKLMRGQKIDAQEIHYELADVLSYLYVLAFELGIDLDAKLAEKLDIYEKRLDEGQI